MVWLEALLAHFLSLQSSLDAPIRRAVGGASRTADNCWSQCWGGAAPRLADRGNGGFGGDVLRGSLECLDDVRALEFLEAGRL
jgi:hypothetical protein